MDNILASLQSNEQVDCRALHVNDVLNLASTDSPAYPILIFLFLLHFVSDLSYFNMDNSPLCCERWDTQQITYLLQHIRFSASLYDHFPVDFNGSVNPFLTLVFVAHVRLLSVTRATPASRMRHAALTIEQ